MYFKAVERAKLTHNERITQAAYLGISISGLGQLTQR